MLSRNIGISTLTKRINVARGIGSLRVYTRFNSSVSSQVPPQKPPVTVDREFPDPFKAKKQNRIYFLTYGLGVTLACIVIFNYEKTTSPIINSVMYFLRRSQNAKQLLGDNINFKQSWPWIWGTLNTVRGDIDIEFSVQGSENSGVLKLKATRESKLHPFYIHHWILQINDAQKTQINLLEDTSVEFGL
mmetsp:Transcript_3819/g.3709  ORF Transcript_3819/g.3709 Transcript_3819/m.3709 type:complete len:189 (-) Transcript_3819:127-693(-)